MLFSKNRNHSTDGEEPTTPHKQERPLSCMIFFFASQMLSNLEARSASSESTAEAGVLPKKAHRLDVLLAEVGEHANRSPYVTRFEPIPVEMSPPGRPKGTSRDEMHDVLLLASFKNKSAWQKWIETPEWQRFMQRTENEGVFRRIPHVRFGDIQFFTGSHGMAVGVLRSTFPEASNLQSR
ncbi:hypothetical protein TSTA_114180 [Talaromyces stipitatus ATCC 10500]|uniref:Uncharacterized protein n=1 Tax=Talaromyces stipitatus (strain ATCC 10500 / CBS 375.48 / QM 6759 / NRRL 1006) TaxID=441959 RepID=B8MD80_TALSN|nr:uncharacterized protein TSTA_114180 [Talaromyces stipitatus ATCC 10500]EED17605.1 hypothetical protein TSTA_114180 [Talaromyces stipitatus ATCC 10500]